MNIRMFRIGGRIWYGKATPEEEQQLDSMSKELQQLWNHRAEHPRLAFDDRGWPTDPGVDPHEAELINKMNRLVDLCVSRI